MLVFLRLVHICLGSFLFSYGGWLELLPELVDILDVVVGILVGAQEHCLRFLSFLWKELVSSLSSGRMLRNMTQIYWLDRLPGVVMFSSFIALS